jgi:hypothetical protein
MIIIKNDEVTNEKVKEFSNIISNHFLHIFLFYGGGEYFFSKANLSKAIKQVYSVLRKPWMHQRTHKDKPH